MTMGNESSKQKSQKQEVIISSESKNNNKNDIEDVPSQKVESSSSMASQVEPSSLLPKPIITDIPKQQEENQECLQKPNHRTAIPKQSLSIIASKISDIISNNDNGGINNIPSSSIIGTRTKNISSFNRRSSNLRHTKNNLNNRQVISTASHIEAMMLRRKRKEKELKFQHSKQNITSEKQHHSSSHLVDTSINSISISEDDASIKQKTKHNEVEASALVENNNEEMKDIIDDESDNEDISFAPTITSNYNHQQYYDYNTNANNIADDLSVNTATNSVNTDGSSMSQLSQQSRKSQRQQDKGDIMRTSLQTLNSSGGESKNYDVSSSSQILYQSEDDEIQFLEIEVSNDSYSC